jgi:hypothetical protein
MNRLQKFVEQGAFGERAGRMHLNKLAPSGHLSLATIEFQI